MTLHPLPSKSPLQEETVHLHPTVGKMLNLGADLLQKGTLPPFPPFSIPSAPAFYTPGSRCHGRFGSLQHREAWGGLVQRAVGSCNVWRGEYRNRRVAGRHSGKRAPTPEAGRRGTKGPGRGLVPASQALVNGPCNYALCMWHLEVLKLIADGCNFWLMFP